MKLITFVKGSETYSSPRVGALLGNEHIIDLQRAIVDTFGQSQEYRLDWFDLDRPLVQKSVALYEKFVDSRGGFDSTTEDPRLVKLSEAKLLAPVLRPGKVIGIGLNYRDHAAESQMPLPERPLVFSKFSTSVIAVNEPVVLPAASKQVDYEAELAVVIGRRCRNVPATRAYEYVLGYTITNDVSARDLQFADGQWQRGKSCDTFAPLGPCIVTTNEIPNPHHLAIKLRLNGKTMQDSNTNQLIFGVPELVEFLSETITLEPGDVIATGTPAGVGFARQPPIFLKPGDVMEVEIEKLGVLRNPVIGEEQTMRNITGHEKR